MWAIAAARCHMPKLVMPGLLPGIHIFLDVIA
jgi:hypothetical protein